MGIKQGIYGVCLGVFIIFKYQDQISDILASKTKRLLLAVKDQELKAEVLIWIFLERDKFQIWEIPDIKVLC